MSWKLAHSWHLVVAHAPDYASKEKHRIHPDLGRGDGNGTTKQNPLNADFKVG